MNNKKIKEQDEYIKARRWIYKGIRWIYKGIKRIYERNKENIKWIRRVWNENKEKKKRNWMILIKEKRKNVILWTRGIMPSVIPFIISFLFYSSFTTSCCYYYYLRRKCFQLKKVYENRVLHWKEKKQKTLQENYPYKMYKYIFIARERKIELTPCKKKIYIKM